MDAPANNDGAPPPAPPPPVGRPSPSDALRSSLRRRRSGHTRLNSNLSDHSQDLQDLRSSSRSRATAYRPPQVWFEEQQDAAGGPTPMSTDNRLLMASLDHEAVEDEAEATLLHVLERRQEAFERQLPNTDLVNLGSVSSQRPVSAPSTESAQPLSKQSLHSRSRSRDFLSKSHRPPILRGRDVSSGSNNSQGELRQMPNHSTDQQEGKMYGDAQEGNPRPNLPKAPSFSNRGNSHQGLWSAPPLRDEHGALDSSQSSGPTGKLTPWERARRVAFKMKTKMKTEEANNMEETHSQGWHLPDLVSTIVAQQDNDNHSNASALEKGGEGSRSRGSHSNVSVTHGIENQTKGNSSGLSGDGGKHHRSRPFSGISSSPFANDGVKSGVENWLRAAEQLQKLGQISEEREEEGEEKNNVAELNNNFLSQLVASHPEIPPSSAEESEETPEDDAGGVNEQTPMIQQKARPPERTFINMWSNTRPATNCRFHEILLWWAHLRKEMKDLAIAFDAPFVKERLWAFFQNEFSLFIVPALAISAVFYYSLDNPTFMILPTDASVSWWILFVLRHYLTLQLAYIIEYVCVDVLATRTLFSSQLVGPLFTLCAITSKGWPYIFTTWGVLNMLLIREKHGNTARDHWLFFMGMEMFSPENPSGGVNESDTYLELLVSMIIAGVATSLKRMVVALFIGKRIYTHYKPKVEEVMESMILLKEVADLGDAIDDFEFEKVDHRVEDDRKGSTKESTQLRDKIKTCTMIDVIQKQKARNENTKSDQEMSDSEEENAEEPSKGTTESTRLNHLHIGSDSSEEIESLNNLPPEEASAKAGAEVGDPEKAAWLTATQEDFFPKEPTTADNAEPPITTVHDPVHGLLRNKSTTNHLKSLLDEWEEPENKQDKMVDPSIQEILLFRKALVLLEDTHPFGSSFGPAFTRDSCIKSAKNLYKRLLLLSPGSPVLNFDLIGVLAYDVDGTFDDKKAKGLVRLFRPDKYDGVSLLHFVQSCDGVYKKIRLLSASVANSTLIDNVLQNFIDGAFGFLLGLIVMSVLHLNPLTLLLSMSTVLVSFAFALGPSAAKMIEGMIMIAVRRPFDLGDRISIVNYTGAPDNSGDPGYHDTWIVEDCNLFTTTLRLSRSNEISTVNNGAIANTRIVNHGRSQNALVNVSLPMRIDVTHDQVQIVQSALKQYIRDNPRVWTSLINFRITKIDPANELIAYCARIQHVKSWQDLLPILQARGDLEKFCMEILIKLDIYYQGIVTTNDVYIKQLPDQQVLSGEAAPVTGETTFA